MSRGERRRRRSSRGTKTRAGNDRRLRAQSHVVGVALLLGVTTLALGGLTATVGSLLDANAATLDAGRVAGDLERAIQPVSVTGGHTGVVSFLDGRLETVDRTVRLVNDSGTVRAVDAGGVVYRRESARVAVVFGAVVRGQPGQAAVSTEPAVAVGSGSIAVGVPVVGNDWSVGGERVRVGLHSRVTHDRRTLGDDEWGVAVETATPDAWERYFRDRGASTTRRDFDGDGTPSVVARFPGERTAHLVFHRLRLEVTTRG